MDEYLKTLLEQIRCKKARPYVKQEFQDHIEDQIEANMQAGMDREQAEREAVRDMGDPVETGISLDSVHRPQVAWKLLGIIVLISIAGVLIHAGIAGKISENAAAGSDRYVFHVVIGLAVMMILYLLDYTVLARFSKIIAVILLFACLVTLLGGYQLNGARYFIVLPGGRGISMQTLMLFYVPIYGAILGSTIPYPCFPVIVGKGSLISFCLRSQGSSLRAPLIKFFQHIINCYAEKICNYNRIS